MASNTTDLGWKAMVAATAGSFEAGCATTGEGREEYTFVRFSANHKISGVPVPAPGGDASRAAAHLVRGDILVASARVWCEQRQRCSINGLAIARDVCVTTIRGPPHRHGCRDGGRRVVEASTGLLGRVDVRSLHKSKVGWRRRHRRYHRCLHSGF